MNLQYKHGRSNGGTISSPKTVRVIMGMMAMCIAGYVVGPPLYWLLSDSFTAAVAASSCPICHCDCSLRPLLSLPNGLNFTSFVDCMEQDSDSGEGSDKNLSSLLVEELEQREVEMKAIQQRADQALLEAKKLTSQYQKESDKCTSGMETCEEAREKAEAALQAQRGLTAMWELRALQKGWKENPLTANIESVKAALGGESNDL